MDTTSVSLAVAAGSHILGLLKTTAESIRALGKAEVVNDLIAVQVATMDLLQKQQALIDENGELRKRVGELEALLELKSKLEAHHGAYWIRIDADQLDGPYSFQLWDVERKLVHMTYVDRFGQGNREWVKFYCVASKENVDVSTAFLQAHHVQAFLERANETG